MQTIHPKALQKALFWATLTSLGLLIGAVSGAIQAIATESHPTTASSSPMTSMTQSGQPQRQFQPIDQPLSHKLIVTLVGAGLIGVELWWFLGSKPKSRRAAVQDGIQDITVTVDGGYDPNLIIVQAGQPVRLSFDRKDPSSCLEEVRLPDFRIAQPLTLNQVTAIEFTPTHPGRYEFTCGMNMFRGVIEVR